MGLGEQRDGALASAEARATEAEEKAEEYLDDLKRCAADFANYRRRVQREREDGAARAAERVARELLSVVDDLERAQAHTQDESKEGLELVRQKLLSILTAEGVEEISCDGGFNPHLHEAMATKSGPDGVVLELVQRGWTIGSRVLRPAKVIVGQGE
jgi:molecular chaperone GrpE